MAAIEQDPEKLVALVEEINDLLEEKERRLGIRAEIRSSAEKGDLR